MHLMLCLPPCPHIHALDLTGAQNDVLSVLSVRGRNMIFLGVLSGLPTLARPLIALALTQTQLKAKATHGTPTRSHPLPKHRSSALSTYPHFPRYPQAATPVDMCRTIASVVRA
jgi:hypothetical protein